jgi:hypothetical protein
VGPNALAFWFSKNFNLKKGVVKMAGKKRQPGKTQENRGGKRSNPGGRPPKVAISQYQLDQMLAKAEKWAKEHKGMTVDDFLLKWIYGEVEDDFKLTMRDRIACVKIWKDYTMAKVQEKNINVGKKHLGPIIYDPETREIISGNPDSGIILPKTKEDPAKRIHQKPNPKKVIPIDGKK